jgi:hypothetical protein
VTPGTLWLAATTTTTAPQAHPFVIHFPLKWVVVIVVLGLISSALGAAERRDRYRNGYLKSDGWKRRRKRALARAGYRCQRCGARGRLDVHHLTYKRRGRERDADLQVLCRSCHQAHHR